jgi:hypothetical protein
MDHDTIFARLEQEITELAGKYGLQEKGTL